MQIQLPGKRYIIDAYFKHSWIDNITVRWTSTGSDPKEHVLVVTFDEFVLNYLKRAKKILRSTNAENYFVIKNIFYKR